MDDKEIVEMLDWFCKTAIKAEWTTVPIKDLRDNKRNTWLTGVFQAGRCTSEQLLAQYRNKGQNK